MFSFPTLANLNVCIVSVPYCTLAEILILSYNCLLPTQPQFNLHKYAQYTVTFYWQLITVLKIPLHLLCYATSFQLDRLSLHSEVYISTADKWTVQSS